MGKSCLHFRTADDLPLEVIAEIIASVPMEKYVAGAKAAHGKGKKGKKGKKETGEKGDMRKKG
jgi:hypothetical protein